MCIQATQIDTMKYSGFWNAVNKIYKEEGIFFGLFMLLLNKIIFIFLTSLFSMLFRTKMSAQIQTKGETKILPVYLIFIEKLFVLIVFHGFFRHSVIISSRSSSLPSSMRTPVTNGFFLINFWSYFSLLGFSSLLWNVLVHLLTTSVWVVSGKILETLFENKEKED